MVSVSTAGTNTQLEEAELWYPELIRFWGMEELVASGWARLNAQKDEELNSDRDCFYHPAWMTCSEMNTTINAAGAGRECREVIGEGTRVSSFEGSASVHIGHETGADRQLRTFYTPRIAEMVKEMYRQDFEMFGYDTEFGFV
jgi:hypothetical protein